MATKPIKFLELHYTMTQFLIIEDIYLVLSTELITCGLECRLQSKLLQNDPDTGRIFSQPPLISLKRDKNISNFLVRSAFQTSDYPITYPRFTAKPYTSRCNLRVQYTTRNKIAPFPLNSLD